MNGNNLTGNFPDGFKNLVHCDLIGSQLCGSALYANGKMPCGHLNMCPIDPDVLTRTQTSSVKASETDAPPLQLTSPTLVPAVASISVTLFVVACVAGGYFWWKRKAGRGSVVMTGFRPQKSMSSANLVNVYSL